MLGAVEDIKMGSPVKLCAGGPNRQEAASREPSSLGRTRIGASIAGAGLAKLCSRPVGRPRQPEKSGFY